MRRCRRFHTFLTTMHDLGLDIRDEWVLDCRWSDTCCVRLLRELGPGNLPDAFFSSSDLMALSALRALSEMGVGVPDRVAMIGLTDLEMSRFSNPPLTTIHIPTEEMGAAAAKVLLQRLDGDESLPRRILFPTRLVERSSV